VSERRDAALDFAAAGMPVLPLDGKVPRNRGGLTKASTDVSQVAEWFRRWPDANVGVVTGPRSGFVVLDVDGPAGLRSLAEIEKRHGRIRTAQVLTSSGGRHLWFRYPAETIRNSTGVVGEGLDVRGDGGYVVAPPSVHENGNAYRWTRELEHVADCPAWLLEDARKRRNGAPTIAAVIPEVIPEGTRDATLASLAGSMRRRGMGEAAILAALRVTNEERCRPRLPESDLERIARSIAGLYAPPAESSRPEEAAAPSPSGSPRKLDGAEFVFRSPLEVPAIWGKPGGEVLATLGESFMLVGPDGVGKTTLMQQLVLGRCGILGELLGLPIVPAAGRVLYLAMDRPAQAARSLRRMVDETAHAETLRERLAVWRGPLPVDVLKGPAVLADWIEAEFPDVVDVVVDSLKDLAPKLSDDEVGGKVNLARQELLARGVQPFEVHHQRKEQRGQGSPKKLADVYGSRWLTAGAGSVVLLWGEPGDLVVELRHLKQPVEDVGPLSVLHDHARGVSTRLEQVDVESALGHAVHGLTVKDAAGLMFETLDPKPNAIEKARRKLESLVGRGIAERRDDPDGLARYFGRSEGA
jgi:replicative DNA helicase